MSGWEDPIWMETEPQPARRFRARAAARARARRRPAGYTGPLLDGTRPPPTLTLRPEGRPWERAWAAGALLAGVTALVIAGWLAAMMLLGWGAP
jgi:hypothetical protein